MPKQYVPNDKWSQKAAKEGYRARSVYKLMELDERFKLLKPGMAVLDLGAAPGSWLQYSRKKVGEKGTVIGIDLQEIKPIEGVKTFQADITDKKAVSNIITNGKAATLQPIPPTALLRYCADIILSDLAHSTSGIKDVDQWRSIELNTAVAEIAKEFLKPGGKCVMKVFRGADFSVFFKTLQKGFKSVKTARVKTSRDGSREIYLVMQK